MNPYASEDFNRIRVNPRTEEEKNSIDHPLIEGKKMDINKDELKTFAKAMEQQEFHHLMNDYVNEISDPKHRPEHDQYLREMEERGEMPVGTKLIQPDAGFCIKTSAKKMISDSKKQFFDQKTFVNVAWHDTIDKPNQVEQVGANGKKGVSWSLPYRVSKGKHDQDNQGTICMTYDVVFSSDVANFIRMPEFKKFVADTAIDGVNRVLAENKEKLSADYKIMKHINCKGHGGKPQLMTVKVATENELLNNIDINKQETKLQKEIGKKVKQNKEKMEAEKQAQVEGEAGQATVDAENDDDDSEKSEEEERPTGIVQPKYKIVHSFPNEIMDHWEGHKGTLEEHLLKDGKANTPYEITVTIFAKHCDSMKDAKLDINESTLVFAVDDLYYLDLNLKYLCDQEAGSAKFDKNKKTLTIRMPVIGLTEDSKRVAEQHYKEFLEAQKQREEDYRRLEMSTLDEDAEKARVNKYKPDDCKDKAEEEAGEDQENAGDAHNSRADVAANEGTEGISKKSFLMSVDNDERQQEIEDKYTTSQIPPSENEEADDKRDATTVKRENFLSIYKEGNNTSEDVSTEPDLSNGIKFKADIEEDSGFELQTSGSSSNAKKPLIQELDQTESAKISEQRKAREEEALAVAEKEKEFDFETAERIDLKGAFIQQTDLVFYNIPAKGYDRDTDVRFAFSSDEFLIELRDKSARGKHQVRRLCQTLTNSIDVSKSEVQLLVDFIVVKLYKQDSNQTWRELGYDIANFTTPQAGGQMESNFLKSVAAPVVEAEADSEAQSKADADAEPVQTDEEKFIAKQKQIQGAMHRARHAVVSFLPLNTESIFEIF